MPEYITLAALLVIAPLGICFAHAVLTRLMGLFGQGRIAPQLVVLGTVLIGNVPMVWAAWKLVLERVCTGPAEIVAGILYVMLTYNAFGFCYFHVLNASETSLHVHIMMELLKGNMPSDSLSKKYSAKDMITTRIERMIALGQLTEHDGHFVLHRGTLIIVGRVINFWRRILDLPLTPG